MSGETPWQESEVLAQIARTQTLAQEHDALQAVQHFAHWPLPVGFCLDEPEHVAVWEDFHAQMQQFE